VYAAQPRQQALQCAACGAALPTGETMSCRQCGATLAIPSLGEANAAVQALAPALREAAAHPSPEVVKRRLDAIDADLPRQRAWAADMQAEVDARRGRNRGDVDWEWLAILGTTPVRVALAALVAFVFWFAWHHAKR
jgi:hypothetical protein